MEVGEVKGEDQGNSIPVPSGEMNSESRAAKNNGHAIHIWSGGGEPYSPTKEALSGKPAI